MRESVFVLLSARTAVRHGSSRPRRASSTSGRSTTSAEPEIRRDSPDRARVDAGSRQAKCCSTAPGEVKSYGHPHGVTDVGRRRAERGFHFARDGLFIVRDGMGGHRLGSGFGLAIDAIAGFAQRSAEDADITWPFRIDTGVHRGQPLRTAIELANRIVHRKAASSDDYTGMGTTVAALIVSRSRPIMTFANVGDSRNTSSEPARFSSLVTTTHGLTSHGSPRAPMTSRFGPR